jgi:hypothetical protein
MFFQATSKLAPHYEQPPASDPVRDQAPDQICGVVDRINRATPFAAVSIVVRS